MFSRDFDPLRSKERASRQIAFELDLIRVRSDIERIKKGMEETEHHFGSVGGNMEWPPYITIGYCRSSELLEEKRRELNWLESYGA